MKSGNILMISSRHIVQVYDVLNLERKPGSGFDLFIRMELLNALHKKIDMKIVDEQTVIRLGLDICDSVVCNRYLTHVHSL